jgi:hypothetical protein
MKSRFAIVGAALVVAACGKPPSSPTETETITGSERFGWDQPAADAGELATFRYALYVDDARSEASDVSCAASASNGRFACTSQLPSIPAGTHTLQVASFVVDGGAVRESARSASVRVTRR